MSPKATPLVLLAGLLGGCAAEAPLPARPALTRAADVAALDEAVRLIAELKYPQAAEKLSDLLPFLQTAGDKKRAAEAMFWLGYCYEKQGGPTVAVTWYDRAIRTYPNTPAARLAADRAAQLNPKLPSPLRKTGSSKTP